MKDVLNTGLHIVNGFILLTLILDTDYGNLFKPFGPASYIPVQRVLSKLLHGPYELRSKDVMVIVPRITVSLWIYFKEILHGAYMLRFIQSTFMTYWENKSISVWLFSNSFGTVWYRSIDGTFHLLNWMIISFFDNFPVSSFEAFLLFWFTFL